MEGVGSNCFIVLHKVQVIIDFYGAGKRVG